MTSDEEVVSQVIPQLLEAPTSTKLPIDFKSVSNLELFGKRREVF
jgi:hypothetical protein